MEPYAAAHNCFEDSPCQHVNQQSCSEHSTGSSTPPSVAHSSSADTDVLAFDYRPARTVCRLVSLLLQELDYGLSEKFKLIRNFLFFSHPHQQRAKYSFRYHQWTIQYCQPLISEVLICIPLATNDGQVLFMC